MASTDADDRRMLALRDGFVRALEGATGACGFEARAVWALRPLLSSSSPAVTTGVCGVLRARAVQAPRNHV